MTRTKLRTTIAAEEREACAKCADVVGAEFRRLANKAHVAGDRGHWIACLARSWAAEEAAAAIRARGK